MTDYQKQLIEKAAQAVNSAAINYGINSPQYKQAKENHAKLCEMIDQKTAHHSGR